MPETDETLTILRKTSRPSAFSALAGSRRYGAASRTIRNGATTWMSSIFWNQSSLILWTGASSVYPALLTMMSILPKLSIAVFTSAAGALGSVRSPA